MSLRFILPLLALFFVGCFHIEEKMTIDKDGSGRVRMEVSYPELAMRFLPGKPTADWVRPNLPDGVQLTSFVAKKGKAAYTDDNGKKHVLVSANIACDLEFDQIAALNQIRVRPDARNSIAAAAGATPGKQSAAAMAMMRAQNAAPDVGPFQKISLVADGEHFHFRRVVQAARSPDDIERSMPAPGALSKQRGFSLRDTMLRITIVCPGEPTKHNAHRVDGRTLTWEFKLDELQKRQDRDWIIRFTCRREASS